MSRCILLSSSLSLLAPEILHHKRANPAAIRIGCTQGSIVATTKFRG
jgi:hypothetical protein